MRLPDPIANTTTEAYLAYKAGVLNIGDLKPSLYDPYLHYDAWLAYWTGLVDTYPVNDDGDPEMLTDEEALVAYLSGVTNTYPEEYSDPIDARITGYLRYLVSARFGRPDYPVNNIEFYLSLMKPPIVTNDTPSSSIELDNTAWAELIDVKMYGDTSQQAYTGKNIIPNYLADTTVSKVTFKKNSDGSITITTSGTASARVEPYLWEKNHSAWPPTAIVLPENTTYYNTTSRDLFWNSISASDGQSRYHRCSAGETYTTNSAETMNFIYIRVESGESVNETIYPQLILDSVTDHSYEPYVGNTPAPNPGYPQPVQTVTGRQVVTISDGDQQSQSYEVNLGKNLFDKNSVILYGGYISDLGSGVGGLRAISTNLTATTDRITYLKCEPNTTYTITKPLQATTSKNRFRIGTQSVLNMSTNATVDNIWVMTNGDTVTTHTYTTGPTARYLIFNFGSATTATNPGGEIQELLDGIQIEAGPTATSYAPYFEPIELCKIETRQDRIYKDEQNWFIHRETGKTVLPTSGYTLWDTHPEAKMFYTTDVPSDMRSAIGESSGYTSQFRTVPQENTFTTYYNNYGTTGDLLLCKRTSTASIIIQHKGITDATAFDSWIAQHPVTLYYMLSNPSVHDEQITNAALIAQLDALAAAKSYNDKTYITVEATDPNLPALLKVEAGEYR